MSKRRFPVFFTILFFLNCFQNFIILLNYFIIRVIDILFLHLNRQIGERAILPSWVLRNLHFYMGLLKDHIYDFIWCPWVLNVALDDLGLGFQMVSTRFVQSTQDKVLEIYGRFLGHSVGFGTIQTLSRGVDPINLMIIHILELPHLLGLLNTSL